MWLVGRALIPDRLNLNLADEGPGRGNESGVTFGEGAHGAFKKGQVVSLIVDLLPTFF